MADEASVQLAGLTVASRRGALGRREFIRAGLGLTGIFAVAAGVLEPLGLRPAEAAQVAPDDPGLISAPPHS